jgi:HAD superfamily hydrolase (TIGR01509 family)
MLKAVIFDLNGTILDDEDNYTDAFRYVLHLLGVETGNDFTHTRGVGVKENWIDFKLRYNIKTKKSLDELVSLTQKAYLKEFDKVKLRKGFLKFVKNLKLLGIKTAIATSNDYSMVEKFFDKFGLEEYFDVVTSSEEVSLNKPSPQIFLLTAEKLGVEPYECLVFEDSEVGVEAAHLAGMAVVGIAKDGKSDFKKAQKVIHNFKDFKLLPQERVIN